MAPQTEERVDIYARVTNKIVKAIETGSAHGRWEMPWYVPENSGFPVNALTGNAYRGVNILTLWVEAEEKGYQDPHWATYQQWQTLGKQVARGERAAHGVFWKRYEGNATVPVEETEDDTSPVRLFGRSFSLFNACQTEGYEPPEVLPVNTHERIASAEAFFGSLGADIRHGGSRAYYRTSDDHIQMPQFEIFREPVAYYGTLAHEATHWSGHKSRLDRDLSGRFGDEAYAAEELIAELGAAFVAVSLGLTPEPRPDHAQYVHSWLNVLKNDPKAIFTAASHAQKAADFLYQLQQPSQQLVERLPLAHAPTP